MTHVRRLVRSLFFVPFLFLLPLGSPADAGPKSETTMVDYPSIETRAERLFADGSFQKAHELYASISKAGSGWMTNTPMATMKARMVVINVMSS